MGRRVVFGVDLKPYLRQYVLVKLSQTSVWETLFGFELVDGIERVAQVKFMQAHPEERPLEMERTLRLRAWLPKPMGGPGPRHNGFWVSDERQEQIRGHVLRIFRSELYVHVSTAGPRGRLQANMDDFIAKYRLSSNELDSDALRMLYYRTRDQVKQGNAPALLRALNEG